MRTNRKNRLRNDAPAKLLTTLERDVVQRREKLLRFGEKVRALKNTAEIDGRRSRSSLEN